MNKSRRNKKYASLNKFLDIIVFLVISIISVLVLLFIQDTTFQVIILAILLIIYYLFNLSKKYVFGKQYLKTYRKYILINKLQDLIVYLIFFAISTTFSFMIYYTTKSLLILMVINCIFYIFGITLCKLFEIKIVLPSVVYLFLSTIIILLICYYEKESINIDLLEYLLFILCFMFIFSLIIAFNKYETQISIYYKVKDRINGAILYKKAKKEDNNDSINSYALDLLFEKNKLLGKLHNEFIEKDNINKNIYKEAILSLKAEEDILKDLKEQLNNVKNRLNKKNSGAQEYELVNQKRKLIESIYEEASIVNEIKIEVDFLNNRIIELKDIYEKNKYAISNGYNIRNMHYMKRVSDKMNAQKYHLDNITFDNIKKYLEGEV